MTDERYAALVRAVEELNVLPLVDESLDRRDPRWLLQVAAAVSGAAEAQAMVRASTLEARGYHDAPRLIDNVAFRASGMQGDDPHTTSVMWSLWTLSRLQARVALLDASEGSPLSKAATTASRALYAKSARRTIGPNV